jgi:protoporphyrinogen IX oxidase
MLLWSFSVDGFWISWQIHHMLWIKALHIIFVITWFAALFYLPRLFVYHASTTDREGSDRFKIMERKLYRGIMTPSAVLALAFGFWLYLGYGFSGRWLEVKLVIVTLLAFYHFWCGRLLRDFAADRNTKSHVWYRWFNEVPVAFLIAIVILVVVKPF